MGKNEGWGWIYNSTKWHYFRGITSLCSKWMKFGTEDLEGGNDDSPDNCAICKRKLAKEKTR